MPGVSRSGISITAGRFAGLTRDAAARFSFLLLIPIVFGAVLFKGLTDVVLEPLPAGYVRRNDYTPFVIYRLVAAAVIMLVILSGARSADDA
jgi:undecaprenyl-diphosphatase